jgi:hypothetical protein
MSLLRNTSVRTILATVFLVLAVGLCGSLGWQFYGAWNESVSAERALALAGADKAVFTATYEIRDQRSNMQAAVQASGDLVNTVRDAQTKVRDAYEAGIKAVEATPTPRRCSPACGTAGIRWSPVAASWNSSWPSPSSATCA